MNKCLQSDYGVDYDKNTRTVSGFAWAEHAGWVCFGQSCLDANLTNAPDGSPSSAAINDNGLIAGWANYTALAEDGWIKFLGPTVVDSNLKISCRNCVQYKGQTKEQCGFCFTDKNFNGAGAICEDCRGCAHNECNTCGQCYQYGVGLDYSTNTLAGWSSNDNGDKSGFGWLQFHPAGDNVIANAPYLETIGGDVYSQKGIGAMNQAVAPEGKYNATYMLQSDGSIIHFSSACDKTKNCEGESWTSADVGALSLPKQETGYRAELGVIDIKGLLAEQYGEVKTINNASEINSALKGKVYYSKKDLTIDSIKTFMNGTNQNKGNGTIIVRGDLFINANTFYQNKLAKDLKNLASVGWIVIKRDDGTGGNIYVAPNVIRMVGNFYAENAISTGTTNDSKIEQKLEISGLMVAREFKFERDYFQLDDLEPAERVIYDGRVMASPPPGFQNLAKAMPIWR